MTRVKFSAQKSMPWVMVITHRRAWLGAAIEMLGQRRLARAILTNDNGLLAGLEVHRVSAQCVPAISVGVIKGLDVDIHCPQVYMNLSLYGQRRRAFPFARKVLLFGEFVLVQFV